MRPAARESATERQANPLPEARFFRSFKARIDVRRHEGETLIPGQNARWDRRSETAVRTYPAKSCFPKGKDLADSTEILAEYPRCTIVGHARFRDSVLGIRHSV